MNITVGKVETAKTYLDIAIQRARKASRATAQAKKRSALEFLRATELTRITVIRDFLVQKLNELTRAFPNYENLDQFYKELINVTLDKSDYLDAFKQIINAKEHIHGVFRVYNRRLLRTESLEKIKQSRKSFIGRASSIMKKIDKILDYLEHSRRVFKEFPNIKPGLTTIVIAGYPNVGKTSLLKALTGSAPTIAPYPFTTQKIMIGYIINEQKIQVIDTPGLLDRPLGKRNPIELHSIIALKYIAKIIIYIIDPSETCGYPLQKQLKLFEELKRNFPVPFILVATKSDMQNTPTNADNKVSTTTNLGIEELKNKILTLTKKIEKNTENAIQES